MDKNKNQQPKPRTDRGVHDKEKNGKKHRLKQDLRNYVGNTNDLDEFDDFDEVENFEEFK
jgi:hypothetical protein